MCGVVLLDALLRGVDVVAQQVDFAVAGQHLGGAEAHARHVDVDRAHHTPAPRLLHAAPVLERVAHQQVGRQRDNRVVPVTDFDRRERDLLHAAVGPVFGHGNPVAHLQHVVGRELDARYEAEDAVAENQHDDRRRGAQSREQEGGRLVKQD